MIQDSCHVVGNFVCKYCGKPSVGKIDLCKHHLELKWKWQLGHDGSYQGKEFNGEYWYKAKQ